jgi:hypothetical protein
MKKDNTDLLEKINIKILSIESLINFPQFTLEEKECLKEYHTSVKSLFPLQIGKDIFPNNLEIVTDFMNFIDIEESFSVKFLNLDKIFGLKRYKINLFAIPYIRYLQKNLELKVNLHPTVEWGSWRLKEYLEVLEFLEENINNSYSLFFKKNDNTNI